MENLEFSPDKAKKDKIIKVVIIIGLIFAIFVFSIAFSLFNIRI